MLENSSFMYTQMHLGVAFLAKKLEDSEGINQVLKSTRMESPISGVSFVYHKRVSPRIPPMLPRCHASTSIVLR